MLAAGILCSLLSIQAFNVTYTTVNKPDGWGEMTAYAGSFVPSGSPVPLGTSVTFSVPGGNCYAIDWYVNDVKAPKATGFTLKVTVTDNVHVEARYREAYKFIFKDTPYVRYADAMGYVTLPPNYYHNDYVLEKGTGHTVDYWTGSNGKTYPVDTTPEDNQWYRDLLTEDVVLTPHYVPNGKSVGDSTVNVTWRFDQPGQGLLLRDMKGRAPFVQTTVFQGQRTDVVMTIDATQGRIDNFNNGDWSKSYIPASVSAGTHLTLPSLYGTSFRLLTTVPLTSQTTIGGKSDYTTVKLAEDVYESLLYCYAASDSVDMSIGEDIGLISITACFPGSINTLKWWPHIRWAETTIGTAWKTGEAGGLLSHMSDIANNGQLRITPSASDTLTSLIEMPQIFNAQRYMSVDFEVADGYAFLLESAEVPFVPVVLNNPNANILSALWVEDALGQRIDSLFQKRKANVMNYDSLSYSVPADQNLTKYLQGKVTMKFFVFGTAADYRLGYPISISGRLFQRIAFPQDSQWMPFLVGSGIDFDDASLRQVDVYEIVGVRERQKLVTKVPVEECPPGTVILLHAPQPGAVYYVPVTRCDDAFDPGLNMLKISDGTVTGDATRYVFDVKDGKPVFVLSTEGAVIPEGDFYLECDLITTPTVLYLNEGDVPSGIADVSDDRKGASAMPRRIVKNGRVYILKADGSLYNMAGAQVR